MDVVPSGGSNESSMARQGNIAMECYECRTPSETGAMRINKRCSRRGKDYKLACKKFERVVRSMDGGTESVSGINRRRWVWNDVQHGAWALCRITGTLGLPTVLIELNKLIRQSQSRGSPLIMFGGVIGLVAAELVT